MFKSIIITLTIISLLSCSNNQQAEHEQVKGENQEVAQHEDELQLNKGQKWMLDSSTRKNISGIKKLLTDPGAIQDKAALANNFQQQVDLLVSECKMTGKDHEALHQWLEEFINDLKKFKKSDEYEKAILILQKDLEQFDAYFE